MRPVICAWSTMLCAFSVLSGADLTVFLDFEEGQSARSVAEMKAESERLLAASGVSVDWRPVDRFQPGESFPKLAIVKFKGRCALTPFAPPLAEEETPLGFTYSTDGTITPFSEVECDRVRGTLLQAHVAGTAEERDLLYGRALGRVLAHELFHILSGSQAHTKHGVTQKYLSAAKLVRDRI